MSIEQSQIPTLKARRLAPLLPSHAELIEEFLEAKFACSPSTIANYLKVLPKFAHAFQFKSLLEITKQDVQRYFIHWRDQSPEIQEGTFALAKAIIGAFYNWLIAEGRYPFRLAPTNGIGFSQRFCAEGIPLTEDELHGFDVVVNSQLLTPTERALYHVLLSTGARISEVLQIRRQDILLTQRLIVIPKEHTKGRRFSRRVPLSEKAAEAIQLLLSQDVERTGWLFKGQRGQRINQRMSDSNARRILKKIVSLAYPGGWTKSFGAHQFRHTLATAWVERGGSHAVLQQIMGWTSIAMLDQYFHMSTELLQRSADQFFGRKVEPPKATREEIHLRNRVEALQGQLLVQHIKQHQEKNRNGNGHGSTRVSENSLSEVRTPAH